MLLLRMWGFLMLLLLHGADSNSCPSELNPLILDPMIGEYGSEIKVNCTSTTWDYNEMTLSVGNKTFQNNDGGKYIYPLVELSDWNMMAECKIQLDNSTECITEVEITVYKNPQVALSMEKMAETQYKLQCNATNFAPAQNLIVTWYRDGEVLARNSSTVLAKEPVNENFTLVVNINRAEKMAQFRCQAQLDFEPYTTLAPVISETLNISVLYAPQLTTNHSNNLSVSKGENLTLTCEVEGNPPLDFQWTVDGKNLAENTSQIKIIEVNNSATYTCTATNNLGKKSVEIYVTVTEMTTSAAPVTMTTITSQAEEGCSLILTPPEIMVRYGDPVEVNCTSNTDKGVIGWEAPVGGTLLTNVATITWKVEKLEQWGMHPMCFTSPTSGIQCLVELNITLYQTPDVVSISGLDLGPMIEGKPYVLKCDISNVAPVKLKVKWYQGNENVFSEDIQRNTHTPDNVSAYYTVTPERGDNGSVFTCETELQLGPKGPEFIPPVTSEPFTAVVHYKPLFIDFPSHYTVAERNFTMSELPFETDGNPPPTIKWYYQDASIAPHKLLKRVDSGIYTIEAVNIIGATNASVRITVEYSPSLACKEQYEVVENSELENPCELDGLPQPSVTWFRHEKERISQSHWTKHDSGMYLVKATNKHGAVESKFHLQVLYAPEFLDKNTTIKITLGQNVTFTCSAKGKPTPVISWIYTNSTNVITDSRGRYSNITITEATSVNAGVYQCVATNVVASVRRLIKLEEIDDTKPNESFNKWMLPVIIVAAVLILLIPLVLWHNYTKKHGHYNMVANNITLNHF